MTPGTTAAATTCAAGAVPDYLPALRRGAGNSPADGGCLVQVASRLADGRSWTDRADCVHPLLREVAILVNDRMPDADRDRLYPLAAELVGTAEPDPDLPARLALWCAARAQATLPPGAGDVALEALAAAADRLDGSGSARACRAAGVAVLRRSHVARYAARPGLLAAAHAAYAAVGPRYAPPAAARAAAAAVDAVGTSPDALLDLLTGLTAEYRRLTGRAVPAVGEEQWRDVRHAVLARG